MAKKPLLSSCFCKAKQKNGMDVRVSWRINVGLRSGFFKDGEY